MADDEGGEEAIYADENVWLTQKMMAVLYNITIPTINEHLKNSRTANYRRIQLLGISE